MLAELYHAPAQGVEGSVGTATLGSSEAIMLAGLAMKKRWQARMESQGKPTNKPNLVMGYNVQVGIPQTQLTCTAKCIQDGIAHVCIVQPRSTYCSSPELLAL